MTNINEIQKITEIEFSHMIKSTFLMNYKLRIILLNDSFIDVNLSKALPDKFGFHWETMDKDGKIYRYDNYPDKNWVVNTYPYHFHKGEYDKVEASPFPMDIINGFRAFMEFVKSKIISEYSNK